MYACNLKGKAHTHTCLWLVSLAVHGKVSSFLCSKCFQLLLNHIHSLLSTSSIGNRKVQDTVKEKSRYTKIYVTRMWANAQRDGRPSKYKWRPLLNAAKFGRRPLLDCRAVTLPKRETHWNLLGCHELTKWSQLLVGRSSPYCKDMWGRYCRLTSSFSDCQYVP